MPIAAFIFDMDGLLIDSEPHWEEAGKAVLQHYGKNLTAAQYASSTGLRTQEWLQHWFSFFGISFDFINEAHKNIVASVTESINLLAEPMPGVSSILKFAQQQSLPIGLATSSPLSLAEVVINKLQIGSYLQAVSSAEALPFGKPHPQVYLDCAAALGVVPQHCLAFEDSFNGMIAAKAARMSCVVVPAKSQFNSQVWGAANLKLSSLQNFNGLLLGQL